MVLLRNLNVTKQRKYVLCFLMGLGVITGGVAVARVATTKEGKAYDLSWDAVPQSMTRIFEVNVGNFAACVPLFKPFSKYIHAKVSGRDMREMFDRKSSGDSMRHERWYSKTFWIRKSKTNLRSRSEVNVVGPMPDSLPVGVVRMKSMHVANRSSLPPGVVATRSVPETTTSSWHSRNSLGLPLQGLRTYQSDEDIPPVPDIRIYEARRNFHGDYGETFDAKDIV